MAVYRFRIALEDNEEVYREIEIRSTQTYEDFHKSIVESINFDNTHNASFFISDDKWRKGEEIVLKPADAENNRRNTEVAKRLMSKCKMAALIDDPHQKFVYIYDYKAAWTFTVELVKILLDDANKRYPDCIKSIGEAPKQYKKTTEVPVAVEDDFDDDPHADDEAYVAAESADEDIADLEGEEGEEELVEAEEEDASTEEDEFGFSEFENGADGNDD